MEGVGLDGIIDRVRCDFSARSIGLDGYVLDGLSTLVGCMLSERTPNLMVLAESLPRCIGLPEHRYQYISRHLSRDALCVDTVMSGYIAELLEVSSDVGGIAVLAMDQSSLGDGRECLMLSVRVGTRALPVLWEVVQTKGAIGWDVQERLLRRLTDIIPIGQKIMFTADRFYGTHTLVQFCKDWGWGYRIRLKGNLIFIHEGGTMTPDEAHRKGISVLNDATFHKAGVTTNIGILHEAGHPEPWFIAMDATPSRNTILDYGKRWSCEAMFSDFKSRGFSITQSKLTDCKRMERLILVMAIALIVATSVGRKNKKSYTQKKRLRDICSAFTIGIRIILRVIRLAIPPPLNISLISHEGG